MAVKIVRLDSRGGEVIGHFDMWHPSDDEHMVGDTQLLGKSLELVVVHLADHHHADVGELLDDVRERLNQRNSTANRNHMAERQDDRSVAETKLPSHPPTVTRAELIDAQRRWDESHRSSTWTMAALNHLAHVSINTDHQGTARSVQGTQDSAIDDRDERTKRRVCVHQGRVHRQHPRNSTAPGNQGGDEGEIEELSVLMNDVGAGLVEQPPHPAKHTRPRNKRQRVVECQATGCHRRRWQPDDVYPFDVFDHWSVGDRAGRHPHFVTCTHIFAGDVEREVSASGGARREEAVDEQDPHRVATRAVVTVSL